MPRSLGRDGEVQNPTPQAIDGVLEGDQRGWGTVDVVGMEDRLHLGPGEIAVFGGHGGRLQAAQSRGSATFVVVDVGVGVADDLVSPTGLRSKGELISHCPAGNEQGRLHSRQLGHAIL